MTGGSILRVEIIIEVHRRLVVRHVGGQVDSVGCQSAKSATWQVVSIGAVRTSREVALPLIVNHSQLTIRRFVVEILLGPSLSLIQTKIETGTAMSLLLSARVSLSVENILHFFGGVS